MPLSPNSFTPSTVAESAKVNENFTEISTLVNGMRPQILVPITGTLTVGENLTAELPIKTPIGLTMSDVVLRTKTAPTGNDLIVDIKVNGSTIFSTKPQIDAGDVQGGTGAVFSTLTLVDGDVLTFDITQVGSTVSGENLTINLVFKY